MHSSPTTTVRDYYSEAVAITEGRYLGEVLPEHVLAMHKAKLVFFHAFANAQKNITVFLASAVAKAAKELEELSSAN